MKRILKFFPVALAAFALASCSNDELFDLGGNDDFQKDPSKLYVTIEDLVDGENGTTRSGYVYNQDPLTNPNGQYFVWTAGDMVKLYDDVNNWRPQVWQYDEEATQKIAEYSSASGFAVFSENVTETELPDVKKVDGAQYKNAYGVVPFNLSEFTNEQRTSIKFDFSPLQFYSLDRENVTNVYAAGKLAKAIIPLWGVANGNEMKVKYLSGILKVDLFNLDADDDENTHSFLIVQSTKGIKGVKMHPADLAEVGFQPDDDINKAPEISTEALNDATDIALALNAVKIDGSYDVPEDLIIVDLGNAGERTCVAVPLLPLDGQKVKAYVATNVAPNADGEYDLTAAEFVGQSKTTWDVTAGKYYRIMDNASYNVDGVNTLDELARKIKALDNKSDRGLTMYLTDNVNVQGGDDPKGYTLTLEEGLKHDVTLTFAPGKGFMKVGTAHSLVVKTLASEKSLTIDNTPTDVTTIEIDKDAAGPVVLKGSLKNIINNADGKLTIASAVVSPYIVTTYGNLTVQNEDAATYINNLLLGRGTTQIDLKKGGIRYLDFVTTEGKTINADVTINSTGRSRVSIVNLFNLPHTLTAGKYNDDAKLLFVSTLSGQKFSNDYATIVRKSDGTQNVIAIVTAAQLAGYTGAADVKIVGTFNMNGQKWTPLANSASVDGAAYIARAANHNADALADDVNNATINGLLMDASNNTGFFATLEDEKTIKDITFAGVTVSGTVQSNIGTVVGTIADGSTVTIQNITVTGINFATSYIADENTIGGIVGTVADKTNGAKFLNINTAGTISAYGSLGGIVGIVADEAIATFGAADNTDTKKIKDACSSTVTLTETKVGTESDPVYTKIGNFIGSIQTQNTPSDETNVTIYVSALPSARTFTGATADLTKWGFLKKATGRNTYKPISLNQDLIGLSGFYGADLAGDFAGYYGPKRCAATWFVTIIQANGTAARKTYKYYTTLPAGPANTDKTLAAIEDAE